MVSDVLAASAGTEHTDDLAVVIGHQQVCQVRPGKAADARYEHAHGLSFERLELFSASTAETEAGASGPSKGAPEQLSQRQEGLPEAGPR